MAKQRQKPTKVVKFDGESRTIPAISPGRNATKRDKVKIAQLVCEMYATDRHALADCLAACGVRSTSTWWKWLGEIEEIEQAYREAQETKTKIYRKTATERARTMLERHLEGFTHRVTERKGTRGTDPDGNETFIVQEVREKEIYVKPSLRAAEIILYNFDGNNFTRSPEPYQAGNEEIPTDIEITIKGGEMPPVTKEQDIDVNPKRRARD